VKLASPVPLPVAAPPAPRAQGQTAPVPEGAQELEGPGQRRRRGLQGEQGEAATAYVTRSYRTLTEAGDQLALSRVRAGVNFRFTANASVTAGRAVADKVWKGFDAKFTSIKMGPSAEGAATAPERKKAEHTRGRRALRAAM
jgi:hypothetical protein